jgi:hypothetical protein
MNVPLTIGRTTFAWGSRTYVMGILNITPDSFSGDGLIPIISSLPLLFPSRLPSNGAPFCRRRVDILDGVSTPWAQSVSWTRN